MSDCVLFVCEKCHCLSCISKETGIVSSPTTQLTNLKKHPLTNFSKDPSEMKNLVCYNCTEKEIELSELNDSLLESFKDDVEKLETKSSVSEEKTEEETEKEPEVANEPIQEPNTEIIVDEKPKTVQKIEKNVNMPKVFFPEHLCFIISYNELYGTINNMRVGNLKYSPVPQTEVQMGLYFICRYLYYLLNANSISTDEFQLGTTIIFIVDNKKYELLYQEKKVHAANFNVALNKMMWYFEKLFEVLSKKAISPPNSIQSKKSMINGVSYLYSVNDPFNFVLGMKKLLINLKAVQMFQTFI